MICTEEEYTKLIAAAYAHGYSPLKVQGPDFYYEGLMLCTIPACKGPSPKVLCAGGVVVEWAWGGICITDPKLPRKIFIATKLGTWPPF